MLLHNAHQIKYQEKLPIMSITMNRRLTITMENINIEIRNAVMRIFQTNQIMLESYLECYNNMKCHQGIPLCDECCDKRQWFIKNIVLNNVILDGKIPSDPMVNSNKIFNIVFNNIKLKCPNFVLDNTHSNFIYDYLVDCLYTESQRFYPDVNEPDINDIGAEVEDLMDMRSDKSLLFLYYNYYLDFSMHRFIMRMDEIIKIIKTKEKEICDAKRASIVLNKIPNLNYDVISHIAKYICDQMNITLVSKKVKIHSEKN
jgi:hypothetical protein